MHRVNLGKVPHHDNEKYAIKLPDGVPRPPILGLFVGKRGQGKSTSAIRLLKFYVDHKPEVIQKELVFVISPTAESQFHLWDYVGISEDNIYTSTTLPEVRDVITNITKILRSKKEQHDEDIEYQEAYEALCDDKELTPRQEYLLEKRNAEPLAEEDMEPYPRPLLLLDDLSHLKVLDSKFFISLCLRHRHVAGGVGLSMMILCQSLRGGLSRVVRQVRNLYFFPQGVFPLRINTKRFVPVPPSRFFFVIETLNLSLSIYSNRSLPLPRPISPRNSSILGSLNVFTKMALKLRFRLIAVVN